jgi:hypothetical protein
MEKYRSLTVLNLMIKKDGHFVSARKSCTHKVDEKVCCQNLQVIFITHSLIDAVKHACSNTSLEYVLLKQMQNTQLHNCNKKKLTH